MLECKELSRQDKINLLKLGVGKEIIGEDTQASLIASEPRMDLELQDPYKASTITVKFVALKTALQLNPDWTVPTKLFFTFKFFTFRSLQTEPVLLQSEQAPSNLSEMHTQFKIKLGTQYLLTKLNDSHPLQIIFDVDPSISGVPDEHLHMARYLKERILTIDVWNADSLMHFGTVKIPLNKIMRQGEPSKVMAQEYEVCEADFGQYVAGLQMLISNEGRKIPLQDKVDDKQQRHKKKVLSKPIDNFN